MRDQHETNGSDATPGKVPHGLAQELLLRIGSMLESNPDWQDYIDEIDRALLSGPHVTDAKFVRAAPRLREIRGMAEAALKFTQHFRNLREVVQRSGKPT